MWQRLSALALCGMSALWAGACDGLPTGFPEGSEFPDLFSDIPQTLSFQLSVKHGGPAFRITVRPGWQHNGDYEKPWRHDGVFVHAGDIEVARCQDGKRLQLLPLMAWQPLNFGLTFHADDINFDGYLDFSVLTEYAGSYYGRSYWVYDRGSGLFVQNELTQALGENWSGSIINFDPKKHEIGTSLLMPGCPVFRRRSLPRQEESPDPHSQRGHYAARRVASVQLHRDGFGPYRRGHSCDPRTAV